VASVPAAAGSIAEATSGWPAIEEIPVFETTMTMTGRLTDWPKRFDYPGGGLKATFRLARSERRFDNETKTWSDGATLYLKVTCRRIMAERVMAVLQKGDPVIVRGRLTTHEWEKDGRYQSRIEMEATSVGPDLALCSASVIRKPAERRNAADTDAPEEERMPPEPQDEGGADVADDEAGWPREPASGDPWDVDAEPAEAAVGA
jgi:single-strand DNA-binding protein